MLSFIDLAEALQFCLVSPNVADANSEPANVVDALAMIASGLHDVADAIRHHGGWVTEEEAAKLEGVTVEQLRRDRGHSVPCDATVDRPA